ncbi:MAG: hypothetical protein Q4A74_08950 [Cardiobacteriaceae bacterium]|nr:hypothetical protein [Cardiobacteriaceae bacterium]
MGRYFAADRGLDAADRVDMHDLVIGDEGGFESTQYVGKYAEAQVYCVEKRATRPHPTLQVEKSICLELALSGEHPRLCLE